MSTHRNALRFLVQGQVLGVLALASAGLLVTGCSTTGRTPTDVGSMATPAPMAPGVLSNRPVTTQQFDTGNMAFPAPLPQGDISTTRVR